MNILKKNKTSISVIIITLIVTANILYFNVYRVCGYKVSIGGNTITFVKSKKEFTRIYNELRSEVKSKYNNVIITEDFTLDKAQVVDYNMFLSGDNLKAVMLKKFDILVDVFLMKSDGEKVAYVESEKVGEEVLNSVKVYYSKKTVMDNVRNIDIENKISYEHSVIKLGDLHKNHEIISDLIEYNDKAKKPLITVKVVGSITKEQNIYPATIMKSSSKLKEGVNKVEKEGVNGVKKVTTEIIALNNNTVSQKSLKEEIITKVQNKEILVGNYKPIILTNANIISPSRGSISSNFGMRWGKMHQGVDIAANLGTTINAVLDGTVIFAGWQDGYGKVIQLSHIGGIQTTYAHCSFIDVKKGETIKQGEKIGEVGSTGNSTGPHLHFEVRKNGEPQNPEKYVRQNK
ncbi:MAG: peptidoglycan DD-metalloendopeptidase family protein [Clostridium sp.]